MVWTPTPKEWARLLLDSKSTHASPFLHDGAVVSAEDAERLSKLNRSSTLIDLRMKTQGMTDFEHISCLGQLEREKAAQYDGVLADEIDMRLASRGMASARSMGSTRRYLHFAGPF